MDNFSEILFSSLMFFIVEDQDQANRGDTRMVCDGNGNDGNNGTLREKSLKYILKKFANEDIF